MRPKTSTRSRTLASSRLWAGLCVCFVASTAVAQQQPTTLPRPAVIPPQQGEVAGQSTLRLHPIHEAARKGDVDGIRKELASGVSVDLMVDGGSSWSLGSTALMWAVSHTEVKAVEFLIAAGANVNVISGDGMTPLFLATGQRGDPEIVRMLVEAGANVHARRHDGSTLVVWASSYASHPDQLKHVIKAGANIETRHAIGNMTPLMVAARVGNLVTMRALLEAGASIEARSEGGTTPLMWAAEGRNSSPEALHILLDAGADIEARADDGSTPLMIAALHAGSERVQALIDAGANPLAKNRRGDTALMAAARGGHGQTIALLYDAGCDVNAANDDGTTALMLAIVKNDPPCVRALLRRGAKVNVWNNSGWTPLLLARGIANVEPLIEAGADLNAACAASSHPGWTPLMFAVNEDDVRSVNALLAAGADPDARDSAGRTAIDIANIRQTPGSKNSIASIERHKSGR